ncbi:unnamed protein product [Owenia fusiformis]|uniref:Carbohydrate sulfotransferase n=1 Tax=Owenia fusiformis TaxID=6347 RepID=A0A8S4N762_OWEFU|nr:unnamed protein product [Owenia fusiformis]
MSWTVLKLKKSFMAILIFLIAMYMFKMASLLKSTRAVPAKSSKTENKDIVKPGERNSYIPKPTNLQTICNKSSVALRTKLTKYMLIDETHKLLYCFVPKVGCTAWRKIFAVLSNEKIRNETNGNPENIRVDPHFGLHFKSIKSYDRSQQDRILKSYYKFMFVREPFERLVSAYIDKFYVPEPHGFWKVWGKGIINKYRHKASVTSRECGHDVTFDEFLAHSFSTIEQQYINAGNGHWVTIQQLCNPCDINYDYIGRMESMQQDTKAILEKANVSHLINQQKPSVRKIKENLHFSTRGLLRSASCLSVIDGIRRIINSLIFKGFLPDDFPTSEYTKGLLVTSINVTNIKRKNDHMVKEFISKLENILPAVWENKLKFQTPAVESRREHCLTRLQKSNIMNHISPQKIKQFLEYFSFDFEAFGYDSSFYSDYILKEHEE